jgi:AcrR family transcriptional regulator
VGIALADRPVPNAYTSAGENAFPGVSAPGVPLAPRAADSRARCLEAAGRCVARFGVAKTKVDDIAREARLSRATLYRVFPGGRDEIIRSMVEREVGDFFAAVSERLADVEDLEERIVVAMATTGELLSAHEALGYVLAHEPEVLLPHVSFAELDQLLDVASSFFAPYLAMALKHEDARRVGEWMTRLVMSHIICPADRLDDAWSEPRANTSRGSGASPFAIYPASLSEARARFIVRQFVMPGIASLSGSNIANHQHHPQSGLNPKGTSTT